MDKLDDLDDSNLFCKSLIQKRKAFENINPKQCKQLKLTYYQPSSKAVQPNKGKQKDDDSSEEGIKSNKKQNGNSKKNESESNYFHGKKLMNSCPLCLKSFKTDSTYSAHLKQCAKTNKMTTQQLLEALELQKKQMQERRDLGLCSQIVQPPQKNAKKKIKNDKECYDLALGVALSKSLAMCEVKTTSQEVQKSTLEEFGFNSTVGTSKKKNENKKYPLLKSRTSEERQKIIIEKVAVILLDEDQEKDVEKKKLNNNTTFQNNQVHQLWSLGENGEKRDWYVSSLKLQMLEEESLVENDPAILPDFIEDELGKLNLPQKEIYKAWNKMINNSCKSDLIGRTKDSRDVYLHSLVLFARCPEILEKDFESIFQKYNLATVLIFLEYVYCGTLNGLIGSEINNLYHLAVELNFNELIIVLNELKNNLLKGSYSEIRDSHEELINKENNTSNLELTVIEKKETVSEKDLFTEEGVVDLTQSSPEPHKVCENPSENESNAEKSYWSFIQHEKDKLNLEEIRGSVEEKDISFSDSKIGKELSEESTKEVKSKFSKYEEEEKDYEFEKSTAVKDLQNPQMSEDSTTKDLVDIFENRNEKMNNSDCITLSSGSESKTEENIFKSQRDPPKRPSSTSFDFEVPYFDPYDNFHCFSEEQFSPVGLHSQSLLIGDISAESLKSQNSAQEAEKKLNDSFQEESIRAVGYCSTPVTVRQVSKIKSTENFVKNDRRKRCSLSGSRILRKSLGLQHKMKRVKCNSSKKGMDRRKNYQAKEFVEALTNSILNEISKSPLLNSPSVRSRNFVEITPTASKEDFGESVTPYPNYSNMGESMLKEQLAKYGLKKNLAKSKAKKILRHIYEELHPLYNAETGKIVKILPTDTQNMENKTKTKATYGEKGITKQSKKHVFEKKKPEDKKKNLLNSSKESELMSDGSILSLDGPTDHDSSGSEFGDLSETLTQSTPSSPVDLPSAFNEFIQNNSEYYQKILLYEPIWLEELQKNLKEVFKKHFKLSDIMDFLDQQCITFRSAAQVKKIQKRNEKKKENSKKKKKI